MGIYAQMTVHLSGSNRNAIREIMLPSQHSENAAPRIRDLESMEPGETQKRIDEEHIGVDVDDAEDEEKATKKNRVVYVRQVDSQKRQEVSRDVGQNLAVLRNCSLNHDCRSLLRGQKMQNQDQT